MDFRPNLTTSTFQSATFACRSAKLDSGLVHTSGDLTGDDGEFDVDFLDFRQALLNTIKSFLDTGAAAGCPKVVIDLKERLRDVERDGACHRWHRRIKNPEATQAEISAAAVRQARRRVNAVRRRKLISGSEREGVSQALVPITDPVMASSTIVDGQTLGRFRAAARMVFLAYATQQYLEGGQLAIFLAPLAELAGHHNYAHEILLETFLRLCKDLTLSPVLVSEEECVEIFQSTTASGGAMNVGSLLDALDSISNAYGC